MKIPFSPPDIGQEEVKEVVAALTSGWITTGPRTKKFENMITEFCMSHKTACFDSCTSALETTLRVLGVGAGDEVIVPAYTYTASASVICHVGAKPVMIDCAPNSVQMDYDRLPDLITERTKVVIPVDVGGVPCDYDRVFDAVKAKKALFRPKNSIQEAYGRVIVMADGAHSFGARRNQLMTGALADFTAFSFHAVKNLTTGEGGAITWKRQFGVDSDELYKQCMLYSLHGQSKDALAKTKMGSWEYDIVAPYYKCNMTDIAAAIGIAQMKRYSMLLKRRRRIIEFYDRELQNTGVSMLQHYSDKEKFTSSGHLYLAKLIGKDESYRNKVIERMAGMGVATNVHYKPLPMLTAYKNLGFDIADFPNAYKMYENEITLPLYSKLTNDEVYYIMDCFKKAIKN
ncbi:MAG: DegT/DnrJ/EryC1/StrS aminotransferase family protein [Clostridia bacterium]|nr:DegT/DnrJ/EryC1/StrS aminotransferase family protein [Clostridia bacterium]